MPNSIRSRKQQEAADLKQAAKLKPKLREFVINQQVQNAAKVAKEKAKEALELSTQDEVINRAGQLSCMAFLDKKLWHLFPPAVEMRWLKTGSTTPELIQEMNIDISGFATYLVREYNTFQKARFLKRGYPSPMHEDNLIFFWQKFNADLKLLIETDQRLTSLGNQSVIVTTDPLKKPDTPNES